jgi:hypothetical protein
MPAFQVGDLVRLAVRDVDYTSEPAYVETMRDNAIDRLVFEVDDMNSWADEGYIGIYCDEPCDGWAARPEWLIPVKANKTKDKRKARRY